GGGAGTPRSGAGFARGSHFRAIRSLLSAAGRPAQRPRNNLRSIAALAAPEARNGAAVDLHSHRRRDRPDHPPRRMGVAACLLRSGEVAEKRQGRRQSFASTIPRPRPRLAGSFGTGEVGTSRATAG